MTFIDPNQRPSDPVPVSRDPIDEGILSRAWDQEVWYTPNGRKKTLNQRAFLL